MRTLAIIENESITWDGSKIAFFARGRVDTDGFGPSHGDKWHQNDTSLHHLGKPLNADLDDFGVIPEQLVPEVPPIVLGCQGKVTYKGVTYPFVVGDKGPSNREGEFSWGLIKKMGINDDPNIGGDDEPDLYVEIFPGVPAVVNGVQYQLQRS